MIRSGDVAFHKTFGFGKILGPDELSSKCYKIAFRDGIKSIGRGDSIAPFFHTLDEGFVSILENESFVYRFRNVIVGKGRDYFETGCVKEYEIKDNEINSIVAGSTDYKTKIEYDKGMLSATCSCPYGEKCKHAVATLFKVEEDIAFDLESSKLSLIPECNEELIDLTESLTDLQGLDLVRGFLSIIEILEDSQYKETLNYITYLVKSCKDHEYYRELMYFLFLDEFLYKKYNRYVRTLPQEVLKAYRNIEQYIRLNTKSSYGRRPFADTRLSIISNLLTNNLSYVFILLLEERKSDSFIRAMALYALTYSTNKKIIYDEMNNMPEWMMADEEFKKLLTVNMSFTDLIKYYQDATSTDYLTKYELDEINDSTIFDLIPKLGLAESSIEYFIKNLDRLSKISESKTSSILHILLVPDSKYKRIAKDCLRSISSSVILDNYLYNRDQRDFYSAPWNIQSRTTSIDTFDTFSLNDKSTFEKFFKTSYRVQIKNDTDIVKTYYVYFRYEPTYSICEFDEVNKNLIVNKNLFRKDDRSLCDYLNKIRNHIISSNKDEISKEIKRVEDSIKEKMLEKERQLVFDKIKSYSLKQDRMEAPILLGDSKNSLEISISTDYNNLLVSFRVGSKKLYVVKNIPEFIELFRKNEFYSYGKQLAFYHRIENMKEPYDKVIKYLSEYGNITRDSYYYSNDFTLPDRDFNNIFKLLDNTIITIDNSRYLIDNNEFEYSLNINKDYNLEFNSNTPISRLLYIGDMIYVLIDDGINRKIMPIGKSRKERDLISFFDECDGMNIKSNLEPFKDEIYSKHFDIINIADEIKESFRMQDLRIDAFFDYEDETVTCKFDIYRDDERIEFKDLRSSEATKFNQFDKYLMSIGFNDEYKIVDPGYILNFFMMDFSRLKELCNVYLSDSLKNKQVMSFPKQTIRIQYDHNMMDVFLENSSFSQAELEKVLSALKHKKKYVLLNKDTIINLDTDEAKEFDTAVKAFKLDKKSLESHKRLPLYQSLKASSMLKNVKMDDYIYAMIEDIKNYKEYVLDEFEVNATLKPYQVEGVKWMKTLANYELGGILADDMGLGKTLQTICLLKLDKSERPSLIVSPKSLIFNWKNEFQKFDPDTKVMEIYGPSEYRKELISSIKDDERVVYLTSYDSLRSDIDEYKIDFNYCILDEAQVIKNVKAQKSESVKRIKATHRFALTGTPIENNIIDLWSIFDFLLPDYFEELATFMALYQGSDEFKDEIAKRIAPFILRRTKKDVLKDLPPKFERVLAVEMGVNQRKVYDAEVLKAKWAIDDGGKGLELIKYLLRLRQICVDPSLFLDGYTGGSEKMRLLYEIIDEYTKENRKILIFSQFVSALNIIGSHLKDINKKFYILTGDTPAIERVKLCDDFNNSKDVNVFLISLKAGGNGLNLIGADTVIHLDPWWNTAAENQATDRAHRIGQTKNLEVIKLICEKSIEQRVIELQNLKKNLIDRVISNDDSSITGLSTEDLMFILQN